MENNLGVPLEAQWVKNMTSFHEDAGSILSQAEWVKDSVLLQLWCRLGSDPWPRNCICCSPPPQRNIKHLKYAFVSNEAL